MNQMNPAGLEATVFEVIGREHPEAIPSLRELEEGVRKFWTTYSIGFTIASAETVAAMGGTLEEAIQARIAYIQVSIAR